MRKLWMLAGLLLCSMMAAAQEVQPNVTPMEKTPVYRVTVVARSVDAVNYRHRKSTRIDFRGTGLMPDGSGVAKVESKAGRLEIDAELKNVRNANYYGYEYLTYVLWAITPEGRPVNLGEVVPNDRHEVRIQVTANLQAFGMIVTAEPYFAVTRPSNMTVLENVVRHDTKGWEQPVTAKYEATEKGEYTVDVASDQLPASHLTPEEARKIPLTLLEARNAVAIAKATGAQQYAPDSLARAEDFLNRGEDYLRRKQSSSAIGTVARGAAQAAEDARILTIRRKADAEAAARQKAAEEHAQAEQARAADAQKAALQAQQERQAAEQAKAEALQAQQQAEAARQAALAQQQALAAQAQTSEQRAQQAERDKEEMRQRLMTQLNQVLQTRDTARGLVVNMSDVLFDLDRATLKPGAKVRLAKVAGIIQAYPDLKLQIEGYTDSTGTLEHNQELSERRAAVVKDFLIAQGVSPNNVTAQGLGPSNPVATNSTPQGRQMNRRVDLVVNGESIAAQRRLPSQANPIEAPAMGAPVTSNPREPVPQPQSEQR